MTERSFAVLQPAPDEVAEVAAAIADEVAPKSASATKNARTMLISKTSFTLVVCRLLALGNSLMRLRGSALHHFEGDRFKNAALKYNRSEGATGHSVRILLHQTSLQPLGRHECRPCNFQSANPCMCIHPCTFSQ